ncbi:MAG: acyltransferase family protein [Bacteroidaceae bacterium]|nr:acyltransferase family protein [Bacteroidaceae bacterium]
MNKRVDYIDLIKGIAIWGVVWVHTSHPSWLTLNFIFFILGGFFFKRKPFKTFLREKVQHILIPFLFFYLLSYPYRIIEYYWDNRTLVNFNWDCIFDLFKFVPYHDYLFVNVPLWFLVCFFSIQLLYYFISYLDKRSIIVIALLCLGLKNVLFSIPTFFMVNNAFYYMGFFALGNIVGKPWIAKLKDMHFRKVSLIISLLLLAMLFIPINSITGWWYETAYQVKLFMVFFILMSVASWFNEKRYLSLLRFYGENSLTILGLHLIPLIVLKRITNAIFGETTIFAGFVQSVIVMAIMYVVILFCNKYIPFLVGKKQLKATA